MFFIFSVMILTRSYSVLTRDKNEVNDIMCDDQLSSVFGVDYVFSDNFWLLFSSLCLEKAEHRVSDWKKSHWPLRKRKFLSQNKTGWRSNNWGVVWQWGLSVTEIAGGRHEQLLWPPCLAVWGNHYVLAKESSVGRWRNPSLRN